MTPDIYGQLPPELVADQRSIERQQKIAEALLSQGMTPLGAGRMVGNTFVPPHFTEGLAKLAQAYVGNKGTRGADAKMADVGSRYQQMYADEVARLQQLRQGSAPRPQQMSADDLAMIADQGGEAAPTVQDVKPASRQQITDAMLASRLPQFQKAGLTQMAQEPALELKEQELTVRQSEGAENRKARLQERILALESVANNAALAREERAARAAEAATLRRELAQMNIDARRDLARFTAANRPEKLITVMDPNGNAITVPQSQVGGMPIFNAQASKQIQDTKKKGEAKEQLTETVGQLKGYYDELKKGGGIVEQKQGALGNIASRIQASAVGQTVGGAVGTKNQEMRQKIEQTRPLLLNLIKNATGMSAQQMNSNAEMQLYLRAATDPTLSYEANIEALGNLDKLFGLGLGLDNPASPSGAKTTGATGDWSIKPIP